jgi:hypothetical protein
MLRAIWKTGNGPGDEIMNVYMYVCVAWIYQGEEVHVGEEREREREREGERESLSFLHHSHRRNVLTIPL